MKTRSVLILFTGIAIGAIGGYLFTPERRVKPGKAASRKSKKYNKAFKATASKYREKLGSL